MRDTRRQDIHQQETRRQDTHQQDSRWQDTRKGYPYISVAAVKLMCWG
jgi:hypothetical protein